DSFILAELWQVVFVRLKHFIKYLFSNSIRGNKWIDGHGKKCFMIITCHRCFCSRSFKRFDLLDKPADSNRQIPNGNRFRRSEERRVGKEGRRGGAAEHRKEDVKRQREGAIVSGG